MCAIHIPSNLRTEYVKACSLKKLKKYVQLLYTRPVRYSLILWGFTFVCLWFCIPLNHNKVVLSPSKLYFYDLPYIHKSVQYGHQMLVFLLAHCMQHQQVGQAHKTQDTYLNRAIFLLSSIDTQINI